MFEPVGACWANPTHSTIRSMGTGRSKSSRLRTARVVARILMEGKLVDVPVNVVNKPSGSGTIGLNYVNQHPGDAHTLIVATTGSISNHIMGLIPYDHNNFTPVAMLFDEYLGINVKTDSPLKNGREFADILRKDPEALSIGISTSVGGANHTTLMICLRAAGINLNSSVPSDASCASPRSTPKRAR